VNEYQSKLSLRIRKESIWKMCSPYWSVHFHSSLLHPSQIPHNRVHGVVSLKNIIPFSKSECSIRSVSVTTVTTLYFIVLPWRFSCFAYFDRLIFLWHRLVGVTHAYFTSICDKVRELKSEQHGHRCLK